MLELGGLAQRVDHGFPVLETTGVGVIRPTADLQDHGQRTLWDRRGGVSHRGFSYVVVASTASGARAVCDPFPARTTDPTTGRAATWSSPVIFALTRRPWHVHHHLDTPESALYTSLVSRSHRQPRMSRARRRTWPG